jgi:hypothetical protein
MQRFREFSLGELRASSVASAVKEVFAVESFENCWCVFLPLAWIEYAFYNVADS